jgi:1,4-alpha-glucan branching enzyme
MLKKKFFKTKDECEVTFEVSVENADQVALVSEHNGWEPIEMKQVKDGPFRAKVRLPKEGEFQFRYLVNGQEWHNDNAADGYMANEHGSENSVISTTA